MHRALDALPGVEIDERRAGKTTTGIGLRIVVSGERNAATLDEAKRRLQAAFPDARISS
jgi:hypothetical protein